RRSRNGRGAARNRQRHLRTLTVVTDRSSTDQAAPGQSIAVAAELLFLANLLLAPGLAFAAIFWLWRKHPEAPPLARNHLKQTFYVSLWGGILISTFTAAF